MKTTRNYRRMVPAAMAAMICFGSVISPANTKHTAGTEITASAVKAGISQQDAVNWAKTRVAEGWHENPDGVWGCQCVDLVYAYGKFLGENVPSLNAYEYASWSLPAGWTKDNNPRPGDIFVQGRNVGGASDNGHTGIVISVNGNSVITAETNYWTDHFGNPNARTPDPPRDKSKFTVFIHPNFGTGDLPTPPQPDGKAQIASVGGICIRNLGTGKYLNYCYGWKKDNYYFPFVVCSKDGSPEQTFNINDAGGNKYRITSGYDSGISMNVWASTESDVTLGCDITGFSSQDNNTQKFYIVPIGSGEYLIESGQNSKLVLGTEERNGYTHVVLQAYDKGNRNQVWDLEGAQTHSGEKPNAPEHSNSASVADGKYNVINSGTGKYMNYCYGWKKDNYYFPFVVCTKDGSPEQTFNLRHLSGGKYRVTSGYDGGISMNVWASTESDVKAGCDITGFSSQDNNTQTFYFVPVGNGEYVIESGQDCGLVFGLSERNGYTHIVLQNYDEGNKNQRWKLNALDTPAPTEAPVTTKAPATTAKPAVTTTKAAETKAPATTAKPSTTTVPATTKAAMKIIPNEITMKDGDTNELLIVNAPDKTVKWTSSNTRVATVKDGVVTAVGAGETEIYAVSGGEICKCSITVEAEEAPKATMKGDANGDSKINVADAVAVMQYISNHTKYALTATALANADCDGVAGISGNDAIMIQKMDAGIIKSF
jgi:hypothetical protein